MQDELLSMDRGAARLLVLNRSAERNALTPALARRLTAELDLVEESPETRAVLLTGQAGHFCAGIDLDWFAGIDDGAPLVAVQREVREFQDMILAIVRCPVPVVALVAGEAGGMGFDLALACDLRVTEPAARFRASTARLGLVPDGGSTFTLARLVGVGQAMRLLMTGEELDGAAAARLGVAEALVEPGGLEAHADRLVAQLAEIPAATVRATKRLCRAAELGVLEQVLAMEGAAQLQGLKDPEFRRRLHAALGQLAGT